MSDSAEILSQLRDIRTPEMFEEPALWPALLCIAVLVFAIAYLLRRYVNHRSRWARDASREIKKFQLQPPHQAIQGFATVLKRTMLHLHPEPHYRTMHGDAWLALLDGEFSTDFFTRHEGRLFGDVLYQKQAVTIEQRDLIARRLCQLLNRRGLKPW